MIVTVAGFRQSAVDSKGSQQVSVDGETLPILTLMSSAYRKEVLGLLVAEANKVAKELSSPEKLPISATNLISGYITPPVIGSASWGDWKHYNLKLSVLLFRGWEILVSDAYWIGTRVC